MIRAVIFDIGGVLERNPRTGWQQRWAARVGLEPSELDRRLQPIWSNGSIGAITLGQVEDQVADALGLDQHGLAGFMRDAWQEYLGTLNTDLAEYFAALRPRFRTGILSNSFVGAREREQAAYGFEAICDVVVYSHEQGLIKPDPRIYRVACEQLGVGTDEALFLDDVQACVDGALDVGMTAIKFNSNQQAVADLRSVLGGSPAAASPPRTQPP